jgi:hypothetical protein
MRSYEKPNPEKTVSEPKQVKAEVGADFSVVSIKDAGQYYKKKEGMRMPYSENQTPLPIYDRNPTQT